MLCELLYDILCELLPIYYTNYCEMYYVNYYAIYCTIYYAIYYAKYCTNYYAIYPLVRYTQTWLPSPDHDHDQKPRFGGHERARALLG